MVRVGDRSSLRRISSAASAIELPPFFLNRSPTCRAASLVRLPAREAGPGATRVGVARAVVSAVVTLPSDDLRTGETFFWACSNRMAASAISMIGASWIWLMRSAGMPLANRNLPSSS